MRPRITKALLLTAGILTWILVAAYLVAVSWLAKRFPLPPAWVFNLALSAWILITALYIRMLFSRIERLDVLTMLWRLFIIGMVGITFMLTMLVVNRQLVIMSPSNVTGVFSGPIFYFIGFFALIVFFLSAVFIYKRFILYQKTRRKLLGWNMFISFLGIALFFTLVKGLQALAPGGEGIDVWGQIQTVISVLFGLLLLYLSSNVSWTAYLNFNQKLKALGLFVLIIVVSITYFLSLQALPGELNLSNDTKIFLGSRLEFVLINYLVAFTITYSGVSILVLFFNLPTSSVFELKSNEIASSIKINQAIQGNLQHEDILTTLLDASMLSSNATAGWVETFKSNGSENFVLRKGIENGEVEELYNGFKIADKIEDSRQPLLIKNTRRHKNLKKVDTRFKSLLGLPVISKEALFAVVYVANEVSNSFEDVTVSSLSSFAQQAGAAIENAGLIRSAIELERYHEQLKIAKAVQKELLPIELPESDKIEIVVLNETADEVGGDYFDMVKEGENRLKIAVGDVSGKGTTAAFYMAEVKGIFHSLTLAGVDAKSFVTTANMAISNCFQRGQFMTLTYLDIDLEARTVEMVRAGHCPSFYYDARNDKITSLREGTMGLGIIRNETFSNFLTCTQTIHFHPGDFLVLYTDGIVEARNAEGDEYGYERFENLLENHKNESLPFIGDQLIEEVQAFAGQKIQDDYTVFIIKFLEDEKNKE